ncbi:MAG TPA: S-methyl-5'-thioadenosine phosphorylase [Polyangiaceae bacterium LLY-WYZ-14_1]|nr:S-methyl-5'-thioadenosine phosphorylase [Polyangiaceae bacterium LLY-WYZ-14_1]
MTTTSSGNPTERTIGIIGGSGLYAMDDLEDVEELRVETTFGPPSDAIVSGRLDGVRMLFLPRHGRGHRIPPHEVNYRGNLLALKQLGAEQVVSVSAVGSMKESIHPGDFVLVDQFVDRTRSRPNTFFEGLGVVAHVELAEPIDPALSAALGAAAEEVDVTVHRGGTYVCIEGPQFSTRAESNLYRSWGVDVIGMTNLPEARLAREAELPYATVAMVTDYDCWHQTEGSVNVQSVLEVLRRNVANAQRLLRALVPRIPDPASSPARDALAHAILTAPERITPEARAKLEPLIARHLS